MRLSGTARCQDQHCLGYTPCRSVREIEMCDAAIAANLDLLNGSAQ